MDCDMPALTVVLNEARVCCEYCERSEICLRRVGWMGGGLSSKINEKEGYGIIIEIEVHVKMYEERSRCTFKTQVESRTDRSTTLYSNSKHTSDFVKHNSQRGFLQIYDCI